MDEHVIEALGKARVVVRDGKVVEVGESRLKYCPIFDKFRGIKEINKEAIARNIQFRIDDFGMCTPRRELKMRDYLSFGISEMISTAMSKGMIDAAVMVCEGCGTVIITDPDMVQGIGGRVSGLVSTMPIPELIERVGREHVVDPANARIDQVSGVKKAISMGYKKIAATTSSSDAIVQLSKLEEENPAVNIYRFAVHTTGMSREGADDVFAHADVATGCASKYIREHRMANRVFRVGESVPIFGITERGKRFIEERLRSIGKPNIPKQGARLPDNLS
jgi:putative methanogenesis marker protein 8